MDIQEIIDLRKDLIRYYGEYHRRIEKILQYYNLEIEPALPGKFHSHVPPSARSVPEALAAALHPTSFSVSVEPRTQKRGKGEAETTATKLEAFHHDCLHRIDRARGYSMLLELLKNALLFGMYVRKGPFLNPDLWDDKPVRKGQSTERYNLLVKQWENQRKIVLPVDIFPVNPLNVLPDPAVFTGGRPKYVIESYRRLAKDVKEYGIQTGAKDFEEVDWVEYWDNENRIYFVLKGRTATEVQSIKNPYIGSPYPIPYDFGFCGLGINPPTGKPEEKAMGVMYPCLSGFAAEIRQMSMLDIVSQIYGIPPLKKNKAFESPVTLVPGEINSEDVDVGPLFERIQGAGELMLRVLDLVYRHREEVTYSRTLAAVRLEGVSTGIQQQLLTLQAYKRYEPLLHTLEDTWGKTGSQIAWIVENILNEQVNEHIKPDEIGGYYACRVEFDVVEALERAAKIEEMNALAPIYSEKTRRDFYNFIPEAEDEEEQMEAELVAKHPIMIQALAQKEAERLVGAQALEDMGWTTKK